MAVYRGKITLKVPVCMTVQVVAPEKLRRRRETAGSNRLGEGTRPIKRVLRGCEPLTVSGIMKLYRCQMCSIFGSM